MTDAELKRLTTLTGLEGLYLSYTGVTDAGMAEVARLKSLLELQLYGVHTDAGLDHISQLPALGILNLSKTQVTDDGLDKLKPLTKLSFLFLTATEVSDQGLMQLAALQRLRRVQLGGSKAIPAGIEAFTAACARWVGDRQYADRDAGVRLAVIPLREAAAASTASSARCGCRLRPARRWAESNRRQGAHGDESPRSAIQYPPVESPPLIAANASHSENPNATRTAV